MSKGKILLVDDSPIVRKLAEVSLQEAGYEVYTASDGEEGLKTAETVKPDLILVDFIMPKITGSQFCKFAKENEILKDIPIILITGKGESVGQAFIEKYGVLDYFMKPFKSEDLIEKVESTLSRISEFKYETVEEEIKKVEDVLLSQEISLPEEIQEISFDLTEEIKTESSKEELEITEIQEIKLSEEIKEPQELEEIKETQEIESIEIPEEALFPSMPEETTKLEEAIKPSDEIDKLIEDKLREFSEKIISVVDASVESALKKYGLIKDSSFILSGFLDFFKLEEIFNLINSNKLTGILSVFVNGIAYEFMFIEGQIVYGISTLQKQKTGFKLLNEFSSEEIKQLTLEALSSLRKSQHGSFIFEIKQFSDFNLFNKERYSPSELFNPVIH
uniref:Response regulator n=1 Tax=Thermodesulfovibrio aggregans TaxID=86166 RepID=A0A7C4AK84_9BACT